MLESPAVVVNCNSTSTGASIELQFEESWRVINIYVLTLTFTLSWTKNIIELYQHFRINRMIIWIRKNLKTLKIITDLIKLRMHLHKRKYFKLKMLTFLSDGSEKWLPFSLYWPHLTFAITDVKILMNRLKRNLWLDNLVWMYYSVDKGQRSHVVNSWCWILAVEVNITSTSDLNEFLIRDFYQT